MLASVSDAVHDGWLHHDGLALHHLAWDGRPGGTPVVCLHGVTSCAWVWHHVARDLVALGPVVAPDLRGHGASSWAAAGAYGTVDHAGDVVTLLQALDVGPVDLVGSSWGALVALAVAVSRPDLVRRLVLVDIEPSFAAAAEDVPGRPASWPDLDAAASWWAEANPHGPIDLLRLVAAAAARPGACGALAPAGDPLFRRRWPFRDEDWWEALSDVSVPALVVSAGSSWVRPWVCDDIAARLPRGERAHIAGSTHVVPLDAPSALGAELVDFLGKG